MEARDRETLQLLMNTSRVSMAPSPGQGPDKGSCVWPSWGSSFRETESSIFP